MRNLNNYYIKIAKQTAKLSRAKKLQVGCLIVKDGCIISQSWNGTPSGFDNECEYILEHGALMTKEIVVHAEMNALAKVAKSTNSSDGATLYCTHSPCFECSKAIIQSGIKEVYYAETYRDEKPISFLKQAGIKVEKI